MPTLTPKASPKRQPFELDTSGFALNVPHFPLLDDMMNTTSTSTINGGTGINGGGSSNTGTGTTGSSKKDRMEYLDSLRGILAVVVVFHHFRCGFRPCHMFGGAAEWLSDPGVCEKASTTMNLVYNPFWNGTFAVSVFLVMSGFVLAHNLWKAPAETWRLAVAKRYIRLAIPCAAALVFSYALAGFCTPTTGLHKDAAAITKSLWLQKFPMERPSPVTGLMGQIGWGVWHGTSTLNNAIWTMKFELFGSYLVFLLVALLKGSPHRIRSRWLGALFLLMLVPASTRNHSLEARISYTVIEEVPGGKPGQKRTSKSTPRVVVLDPVKHSHVLHLIHEQINTGNNKETSLLALTYMEALPDPWYLKKEEIDYNVITLDKPMKKHHKQLGITNTQIYRELIGAADPSNKNYSTPSIEITKVTGWITTNPWLWYATLVAGVWMSEHVLSVATGIQMGGGLTVAGTPLRHGFLLLAFLCATYPYTSVEAGTTSLWRSMLKIASILGLGSVAHFFWCIIGAVSLVYYIVVHSQLLRKLLVVHPVLPKLGQISFALYLTHVPILYTLTSAIFLPLYPFFDENMAVASFIAFLASLPVMFGVAYLFWKFVDQPAIDYSRQLAQRMLGLPETMTHANRGYSTTIIKKVPGGADTATTSESSTAQQP